MSTYLMAEAKPDTRQI